MLRRFIILSTLTLSLFVMTPGLLQAQTKEKANVNLKDQVTQQLDASAEKAELNKQDPRLILAETIKWVLGFIGIIFLLLMIAAGYWRLTARGDEAKVEKSNDTIVGAMIGLILILLAYGITEFIGRRVQNAVQEEKVYDVNNAAPANSQWSLPLF